MEETEEDFAGDLNEDYGIYYSVEGQRVEIESEVKDHNPYYETEGEQQDFKRKLNKCRKFDENPAD